MNDDTSKNVIGAGNQRALLRVVMGGKSDRDWRDRLRDAVAEAEARDDSMRQISIRAGRSEGYLWSLIEPGSMKNPRVGELVSIAKAMNLSPAQLFEDGPRGLDPELNQIFQQWQGLDEAQKQLVLQILAQWTPPSHLK